METNTEQKEKKSLLNIIKNNKKVIIYILTFLLFPLIIGFLTTKYTDICAATTMFLYFTIGSIFNIIIFLFIFDVEDFWAIIIAILKGIYVAICFSLLTHTFYKSIIGNPIRYNNLKSNLNTYLKHINYKYEPVYKRVNKNILNKLLKLNYISKIDKHLKFTSYNSCLSHKYKLGINQKLAKNKCFVYMGDNNYKILKTGSLFLHRTKNYHLKINATYEKVTKKKTTLKFNKKMKFKIISIKEDNLTEHHNYLHYTATVNAYSPSTDIYKKLTNKKYIMVQKLKFQLYYYRTFHGMGTNFKFKKVKMLKNKKKKS